MISVTLLALVCTYAKLVTHIPFEEDGEGRAEKNTWTKNEGVRGGKKEVHREAFPEFYSYSSLNVSMLKLNILKR